MKITKYGHSCLLIEQADAAILIDPGKWNPLPTPARIDAILITHEHADHCDIAQLQTLIAAHPSARVITHAAVAPKLEADGITAEVLDSGKETLVAGVPVQSLGTEHAIIYGYTSPCRNTGYFINNELFAPGDALQEVPDKPVRILALPTGGPWMRLSEAIDYAKKLQSKIVFPIHDGMYIDEYRSELVPRIVGGNLGEDIQFIDLPPGTSIEL